MKRHPLNRIKRRLHTTVQKTHKGACIPLLTLAIQTPT